MCISVMGAMSGPFVGIFIVGIFMPNVGRRIALIAFIVSTLIISSLCIWNYIADPYKYNFLPTNTSIDGCRHDNIINITIRRRPSTYAVHYGDPSVAYFARISPFAYPALGMLLLIGIAYLLEFVIDERRQLNRSTVECKFTKQRTIGSRNRKSMMMSNCDDDLIPMIDGASDESD